MVRRGRVMAGMLILALCGAATLAQAKESSVFALFDRGVMSIIAAHACKSTDQVALQRFTHDFSEVAGLVEDELQSMNPDRRRDDLAMVIGFRVAQLELRAEKAVKANGCDAEEVKSMRELFDLKAQLAAVRLSANTVTH